MSIPNGVLLHLAFFLVSTSLFLPIWVVHGEEQSNNTKRPDPLRHLKYYTGAYNIQSKYYWASAAFTGLYGYVIAVLWLLWGIGLALFLTLKHPNIGNWRIKHILDRHSILTFLLVILFTILAIVASSSALALNQMSMKRAEKMKGTIFGLAENAREKISIVTKVMRKMEYILLPYDKGMSIGLNKTSHQLGKGLHSIQKMVDNHSHTINLAIQAPYIAHLVIVVVNIAALAVAIFLLLMLYPGFVTVVILCWILTALIWFLAGVDFFLHNFADDSCSALKEFERNDDNSRLSSVLPCLDPENSDALLAEIGSTLYNSVDKLNSKVTEISRLVGMKEQNDDSEFLRVCNPFSGGPKFSYEPKRCQNSLITIENLPEAIAGSTCYDDQDKEACRRSGGLIPHTYYNMAISYSQYIQEFLTLYPTLQSLAYCTFVKDGISDVVRNQCRPIKLVFRLLWASMLSLAIFMVFLVIFQVARAFQERGRELTIFTITAPT